MSPADTARPARASRIRGRRGESLLNWSAEHWRWLPVALAAVFAVGLLHQLHVILEVMYQNSDVAAAPVLAQLFQHTPPGTQVTLGDHAYYEEFLALLATRGLPLHRQLWNIAPALMSLGGLAVLAWPCRRLFGWWEAAIVVSLLICLGNLGMVEVFSWDSHGSAFVHAAVLVGVLVALVGRVESISTRALAAIAIGLGLFSALPTSGDDLFIVWGLLPFAAASVACLYSLPGRVGRRLAAFGLGTTLVALIGGAVLAHVLVSDGIRASPALGGLLVFATPAQLATNLGSFLQGYTSLAGGDFFGQYAKNIAGATNFVTGALVLIGSGVVLVAIRRSLVTALARATRSVADNAPADPRVPYYVFWSSSLVLGLVAFMLGSPGAGVPAGRYLFGPYVAVAALVPWLLQRGRAWKTGIAIAAILFTVAANYRLHREALPPSNAPDAGTAQGLARYVTSQGAHVGYAEYWDAVTLTWETRFRAQVFPVHACPSAPTSTLCGFEEVDISSWYRPRPNVRSFLIVDPHWPDVTGPSPALGQPISSRVIGPLHVYVFSGDIAAHLGHG